MDVYQAIEQRYSVRHYRDEPVEEDRLRRVLDAGRLAPSARNLQAWKFVVVRDVLKRQELARSSGLDFLAQAPVVVAVVSTMPDRVMFCGVPAAPVDCAIAIDHMTLAAVAEGLGACWVGHFDQQATCELLGVPAGAKVIELVAMGYPADKPPRKSRKSLDEVVCWDVFE